MIRTIHRIFLSGASLRRPFPREFFPPRRRIVPLLLSLLFLLMAAPASAERACRHLVILGDPHVPGQHMAAKEQVLQTVNSWPDVDLVVAVGDLCEDRGTVDEYRTVKRFFGGLAKPFLPIPGNHDVVYRDELNANGRRVRGDDASREEKRRRFRETFGLAADYHSRKMGAYLLVFLAPERPEHLAEMSYRQVDWLRSELKKNRRLPTIVFFHAPLRGTLPDYNFRVNTPNYIAQPADRIHDVLMENPQVFLWVSGHTHTVPFRDGFASPINTYGKHVTNIHNPDMNRAGIWTNSLYLFPDRVVIRTYDHRKGTWLPELERTIRPEDPRKSSGRSRAGIPP